MAVEAPDISAEELREQTRAWLHEHLPAGLDGGGRCG